MRREIIATDVLKGHIPALDPEMTIQVILESLRDLVEYELAIVMSFVSSSQLQIRKAMGPLWNDRLMHYRIAIDEGSDLLRIINGRVPYLFAENEYHVDTYHEVLALPQGHSCLVTPLYFKDRPIGVLTLDHRECNMFTAGIVKLVGTLSSLISTAIVSSEYSERQSRRNRTLLRERNNLLDQSSNALRELVGVSAPWRAVLDGIRLVAGSDVPVLILGETGTGKELVARTIHRLSERNHADFVPLNCSVLTASLAESELFGHERGAFTGAHAQRRGRFELADGGTLFLDEVGDLPKEVQPKLLRVLQDGVFERVGAERAVRGDVRIVAATNSDLSRLVEEGRFREDLYYRLNVYPITVPPLRERPDDILPLAHHFLHRINLRHGRERFALSGEAAELLLTKEWNGNARELQNVIERATILCGGELIGPNHIAPDTTRGRRSDTGSSQTPGDSFPSLAEAQRTHILQALSRSGGRIYGSGGAAELLRVKPSTLQSKMKRLGIR